MSLDMERLLDAVRKVESGDNPYAVSPVGAKGPYQFMDATAAEYGVKNPFDEKQSREGARKYLSNLMDQFGSIEKALAAYNGGPGRLSRRGGEIERMPKESRDYVQRVMANYAAAVATNMDEVQQFSQPNRQPATVDELFPSEETRRRQLAGTLFPNNRENDVLRESLLNPQPVSNAQRIYKLQLRTGLPTGLIERNLDSLEREVAEADFDAEAFRAESPLLAEWIASNPTRAALAQGDYENLSALEKAWSVFKAVPAGVEQGVKKERSMMLSFKAVAGTLTAQEEIERQQLNMELQELGEQFDEGMPSWAKAAADVVGMQIPMAVEAAETGVKYGIPAGAIAGGGLGLIGGPGAPVTVTAGAAAGGLLGFKMFTAASYAEQTYKLAVGEAFQELENAKSEDGTPIDPVAAKYASLLVALPNAVMEFASLRTALKAIPGADAVLGRLTTKAMKEILVRPSVMAAMKDFGKRYAAAVGTETFTEGMQAMNNIIAREIATGDLGGGLSGADAENVYVQSAEAFKASVVLGALASGPKVVELYAQMEKAEQNQQFMLALGDTVANSKTHANSPEAMASYIKHLKDHGPVKNVFIPIEQWDQLFQAEAPGAATEVFGSVEQYAEAKATGGDLVIPLEVYAEKLAGTQFHQQLVPNMRLNPGELTPNEAMEAEQAEPEIVAGLQREMAAMEATEAPLQEIQADVFTKLRDIGMGKYEANRNAILWREHMRAMSDLTGIDPMKLYSEKPLQVQREFPNAVSDQLKKYNQQLVEPPVPFAEKLPLEGGEINLPPAKPEETTAAQETFEAGSASQQEFGVFGATIHPTKGNLAGTEGVAVAGYPQRGAVTEGAPTPADLEIFMRRNRDIFEKDPNAALGVWVDSESGKGYIDIANVLPREVAIAQGEAMGEKAVWDLEAFEEIRLPVQRDDGQGVLFQPAFHGSRAKFDKFMLDHIGTGEGAQAFGWGLYFTDKKEIAESYRENLIQSSNRPFQKIKVDGVPLRDFLAPYKDKGFHPVALVRAGAALKTPETTIDQAIETLEFERGKANYYNPTQQEMHNKAYDQAIAVLDDLKGHNITWGAPEKGQLYKVDIPRTEDMLLWDEPLDKQPEIVKQAIGHLWPPGQPMDGSRIYDGLIASEGSPKAASEFLNSLGIPGVKYLDGSSRSKGKGAYNYVVFDDSAVSILETYYQGERGASVPSQKLIALLKGADPSTFVHESAHLWFEEMRQFALRPDAKPELKQMWETIKEWSGATDEEISTGAHEMFARGFEAYVMEGKAPSFQLREVFSQLMDWMLRIYKSMGMLDVELSDDVRNVFDHLVATDTAIKQARSRHNYDTLMFEDSDLTEAERGAYNQLAEESKREAEDSFRAKVMKELRREKLQVWRDEKKALTPKVRDEILEQPIYRVAYWLWSGKLPDGSIVEGVDSTKLDTQALQDLGVNPADLPFRHKKNGLAPDVVAEIFGFKSGESMVRELIGLPTLKKAIDDEVSRRIREEHGGIIVEGTTMEEAAMEVQNTRQIEVFNMELRLLRRLGAKREKTHPAVLKDIARQIISRKTLRELNPRIFEEAAMKAGQEAQDAMLGREFRSGTGRNLDVAFDAKMKQILNIMLFKEATEQRKAADKSVRKWKKFLFRKDERLAKTRDMNMVNAARAIASVHGIGSAQENADTYMRALKQYDERTYKDLIGIVSAASSDGRVVDDLTVADFSTVRDAIEGLWDMALRSQQVNIDGERMKKRTVTGLLNTRIGELVKPGRKRAGYERAINTWDKTKMGLLGAKAMLTRVEHWVDAMDNGDPNGFFRRFIWQPISEGADKFRDMRRVYLEKYQAIVKALPEGTFKKGKIDAHEIGYEFKDVAELVGAIMHTGNQSSFEKLLIGGRGPDKPWGSFDANGNLDSRKWDLMIERLQREGVLTKAHYDFAQAVGDLFEEMKPEAQKAHKEVFGYYFSEITARPITTPFGNYRGWYYPAQVDPFIVEDAAIREEAEAVETRPSSFIFPDTGHGFTKQRSEGYHAALNLNLTMVQQHMEKVLRFTYLEAPTKDVAKLLIDKDFRNHLAALDSEVASVMLMPWLQRAALQQVEQPSGPRMRILDKWAHYFRTTAGGAIMIGNVSVAMQQSTGLSLAAVKVKPRYLAGALNRFMASPTATVDDIHASSAFMRNRVTTSMMDVQKSIDNILLNPSKLQTVRDFANEHGYFMTVAMQNVVDYVTWGGAYEQAVAAGADQKSAVRQADSAVRETQGTFAAEDISRFEAGTPVMRAFTMFFSFFNMAANLQVTEFVKAMRKRGFAAGGRALYVHAMGFAIPGIMGYAIAQAMRGELFDDDDEDGYLDNMLATFGWGYLTMGTAMVPVVGPAIQSGLNRFNDKWYDDRINVSPAVSALEASFGTFKDAYQMATEEDVRLKRPIKDALTLINMATGIPVAPLAKPLGYLSDLNQGYIEDPENPVELARGLVSGVAPQ